ncbi:MAG: GntR family transcriptional regulator [Planctomycetes bacterium]|nr:GntR family transcriptional regulator [Planctomycetota bacterium]
MTTSVNLSFDKPLPSYAQLQQALREAIVSRKLAPGARLPEERVLAKQFSLSRGTVRRALARLEEEGLLLRHQGRGTFVSAPDTLPAVPLAVVIEGDAARARLGFPGDLFRALMEAATKQGAELLLRETPHQRAAVEPAAFIFLLPRDQEMLRRVAATGKPVIAVDYQVPGPGIDSIVFDNVRAGREATRHLIDLGHRRIAYIDAQVSIERHFVDESNSPERLAGMREALREGGIRDETVWKLPLDERDIRRELPALLKRGSMPTALCAFDETVALGAWLAAQDMGLRVPEDFSIACFRQLDAPARGGIDWTGCGSTVRDLGQMAVQRAIERAEALGTLAAGQPAIPPGRVLFAPHQWCPGATTAILAR